MDSDAQLIGRSLKGNVDALVEVVGRHEVAVGSYLARRGRRDTGRGPARRGMGCSVQVAADYDRSFPDAGPWLFGVALNRLRRYWRSRPADEPVADVTGMASGWDPWSEVDIGVDVQAVLRQALTRLGPGEREVLRLVAWEDLTVADAARVLGIPPGTRAAAAPGADGAAQRARGVRAVDGSQQGEGGQPMADEMDLLSELKGAEPVRPGAYEQARAVLRAAMAEPRNRAGAWCDISGGHDNGNDTGAG